MNKDQLKGTVKVAVGKAQKKVGDLTGDTHQQAVGLGKQAQGRAQQLAGDAKALVQDIARKR